MNYRTIKQWPNGSTPEYTFFTDFDIACNFGISAIKDTYNRIVKEWGKNYKAMTEVSLALNLLCWDYYENGKESIARCLADLYYKSKDYFYETFKNREATNWYFEMTD